MESPDFHFHFPEGFLEEYLNRGKCIVILDGLDEIKDNNLLNVSRKISEFVNRYVTPERGNRCVLCSRPTTLEEVRNLFDASAICQIQDFDEKLEGTRNLEHRFDESCEGGEECVE
jgi:predicted NACHT family NTPase